MYSRAAEAGPWSSLKGGKVKEYELVFYCIYIRLFVIFRFHGGGSARVAPRTLNAVPWHTTSAADAHTLSQHTNGIDTAVL